MAIIKSIYAKCDKNNPIINHKVSMFIYIYSHAGTKQTKLLIKVQCLHPFTDMVPIYDSQKITKKLLYKDKYFVV